MFRKAHRLSRAAILALALCASCLSPLFAQQLAPGPSWERLRSASKGVPPRTKVHVAGDRMSKECVLESVTDEALVCRKGHTDYTFPRAEVKSVKRARPLRSTLAGAGIGLGVGLAVGAITGHIKDPPAPQAFLDFSGISRDVFLAAGGVAGIIGGGVAGGTTDFARGPILYLRTPATPVPKP